MKKTGIITIFEGKSTLLFFVLLFIYQLLFIFQGIDINDEGACGAFYQQIFKNPQSVEFSFMYWMSGVIGGAYLHFFPSFGLLALRLGGILLNMSSILVVYNLLKKHINTAHLKLGLSIAVLLFNRDVKVVFYNNISVLFFVLMIWLLFTGLEQRKLFNFFMCGLLLSVNTFVRLPNAIGIALGAAIIYYAFTHKLKWQYVFKLLVIYGSGLVLGIIAIIAVMKYTGQYDVFMNSLAVVKEMGKNKENTHNIKSLIFVFLNQYPTAVIYALECIAAIIIGASVISKLRDRYKIAGMLRIMGYMACVIFIALVIKEKLITVGLLTMVITGLCLVACFFLTIKNNHPVSLLAFMALIMATVALFGTDTGLMVAGKYTLWLILPLATHYYFSIITVGINSTATYKNDVFAAARLAFSVTEEQLRVVRKFTIYGILTSFLFFAWRYNWNDSANRTAMRYPIHNNFLKGIFTTREKATAINELLAESSKYVKKDDYVLAFDAIPLFYPMTETVPFMRCSWPQLYDKDVFGEQLKKALEEKKMLPVVIYQKGNTLYRNWPDSVTADTKDVFIKPHPGEVYMNQFLVEKQYKMVWENIGFSIYIPPKQGN